MIETSRRNFLRTALAAQSTWLPSLVTGVPVGALLGARRALASDVRGQRLIIIGAMSGDPFNGNTPGAYGFPSHPPGTEFEGVAMSLGGQPTVGARLWSELPQPLLDRTAFIYHASRTLVHPDLPKVWALMGDSRHSVGMPEFAAQHLAGPSDALMNAPVGILQGSVKGPLVSPPAFRATVLGAGGPLGQLTHLRDKALDRIHRIVRDQGTQRQRALIDRYVRSQSELRTLDDNVNDIIQSISGTEYASQIETALAVLLLNISPVVALDWKWGGDNHTDPSLDQEGADQKVSIPMLGRLYRRLQEVGLDDTTTICVLNVFGRTVHNGTEGREHNPALNVMMLSGPQVSPGVFGGVGPDGRSQPFSASSGAAGENADISLRDSLAACGKTMMYAVGLTGPDVDYQITRGATISAALRRA